MNAGNGSPSPNDTPPLSLSLWSIRYRMIRQPNETLELIEKWGISAVEIAGFFNYEAEKLQEELTSHHLKACSLIAPPLVAGRDFSFYQEWIHKYLEIFQTDTIVMQSLPENFQVTETRKYTDLLIKIARELQESGVRVSYHGFPHDFRLVNGQSFISRLFSLDVPDNLGLQLDTYWLNVGKTPPSTYAKLPVHSVHLNERNKDGENCVLGTDKNKCVKYIQPLIKRELPISWILENDSSDNESQYSDGKMMNTIRECFTSWHEFWYSLKSFDIQPEKDDQPTASSDSPAPSNEEAGSTPNSIHYSPISDSAIFATELNDVLTEFLFGDDANLDTIEMKYPKLKCYVDKRESRFGGYHDEKYYAERLLFSLFWPSEGPGMQVIHLVGGAGAGKSTFTRFFFRHFLPYYETLVNDADLQSDLVEIHTESLRQHILLYVDLRREMTTAEMIPYLYDKLGNALAHIANQRRFTIDAKDGERCSEAWVKRQISRLAGEVEGNKRKWYISWILDNSDQLDESEQSDLIKLLFDWIPEEPSNSSASAPVLDGQHRELWRIIIPIRPETLMGLAPRWNPLKNRKTLELDPIDHDLLIDKRAEYLSHKVSNSTKNPFVDILVTHPKLPDGVNPRPHFNMAVPSEKASEMRESLRVAYGGKGELPGEDGIPYSAKPIFDQLVNGSARRRLYLVRKVAFSPVFHERRRQGHLSAFFFFEGLIRGNDESFQSSEPENLVMNLYCLGDHPKDNPYSIFVGLHAIFLLKQEKQWKDAKNDLRKIGYPEQHLLQCEIYLKGQELIKQVAGAWRTELPIVQGHWALMQERAYTDNMAVACAIAWGTPGMAAPTNPLYSETLLPRFTSSLWFLKKIWKAEYELTRYPSDPELQKRCGNFNDFSNTRKTLNLPSITNKVSYEYLNKMIRLREYLRPSLVIDKEKENWDSNIKELENLVYKSNEPNALEARRD